MIWARLNLFLAGVNVAAFVFWCCELRAVYAVSVFWLVVGVVPAIFTHLRALR